MIKRLANAARLLTAGIVLMTCASGALSQTGTPSYPSALDTEDTLFRAKDAAATTLATSILAGASSFTVADGSKLPTSGALTIDGEMIFFTRSGNTVTATQRGAGGTTAAAHSSGAAVRAPVLSIHHNTLAKAIVATETALGASHTSGKLQKWNGTSMVDSLISESGSTASVGGTLAAGAFAGNLTGNVTGNVAGNLTGNVTGNITGATANFSGTATANAFAGNGSALTGIAVGTSTGSSAPASLSFIFDSDNSGAGSNDAGGILDFIQGSTTRARVHNNGQLEAMSGFKVSGGNEIFTGSYTDWRGTDAQSFPRNTTQIDQGADYWINHYIRNARVSGNDKGQFGLFSEILTTTGTGGFAVPIYGGGMSPAGNTGTASVYGANFLAWIGEGAAWPDYTRGVEIDLNNNKAAKEPREPGGPPGFQSVIGLEIASGGLYKPDYAIRITGSNPADQPGWDKNSWQVGIRCGIDCFNFRALELANPPVAVGGGLIVGQAMSGFDTLNFARNLDSGYTGNFIRLRSGNLTTEIFKVDLDGSVYTNGLLVFGADPATSPYVWKTAGNPNGVINGRPGAILTDTTGAGIWYKASGVGTNTGWVLK